MTHGKNLRRAVCAFAITAIFGGLSGCATKPKPGEPIPIAPGTMMPFVPHTAKASLYFAEGAYPGLFSPACHAEWAQSDPLGMVEVSCTLESAFADTAIAYDVVGLRGLEVFLLTPEGMRIPPVRILPGGDLQEDAHGALKVFRREDTLYFPAGLAAPAAPAGAAAPAVRLVLEGYDSIFYFEWQAVRPEAVKPLPLHKRPAAKKAQSFWTQGREKGRERSHRFD